MALNDFRDELAATAIALAVPGTGLLAADESTGTIGKRSSQGAAGARGRQHPPCRRERNAELATGASTSRVTCARSNTTSHGPRSAVTEMITSRAEPHACTLRGPGP